jgi:hypothetical protein
MLNSQKIAIAAHLHVLLRRKTGRVTDTEWMAKDTAYAKEVIRFARASALQDGHADLAEWAAKLEAAVLGTPAATAPAAAPRAASAAAAAAPEYSDSQPAPLGVTGTALRYVRGIR